MSISEEDKILAEKELKKRYKAAEEILKDKKKSSDFLEKLEKKIKSVPKIGDKLSDVVVMAQIVRSYIRKEYTKVPLGTIVAIVAALLYFVSPIDLIPDEVPVAGFVDDALVISVCWAFVAVDIQNYIEWRDSDK